MVSIAPPARDAFLGGSKTINTPPPGVFGAIPPASTRNTPVGGVAPSGIKQARPNEGSNIGIPYARLVPASTTSPYGLPKHPKGHPGWEDTAAYTLDVVKETDDLRNFTAAFILGRRVKTRGGVDNSLPRNAFFPFSNPDPSMPVRSIVPGMNGVDRFQQLCSFEYLQRYFDNCLAHLAIDLGAAIDASAVTNGTLTELQQTGQKLGIQWVPGAPIGAIGPIQMQTPGDPFADVANAIGYATSAATAAGRDGLQGVFAQDDGPFLRGRCLDQAVYDATPGGSALAAIAGGATPMNPPLQPFQLQRALGDAVAFAALDHALETKGLTDWRPDGVVLSKGVNDPSDRESDMYIDARDGQLFNVRVQGPGVTSTWTGDPNMEVLPLDKVFVVIVADVWWDGANLPASVTARVAADGFGACGAGLEANVLAYFNDRAGSKLLNRAEFEATFGDWMSKGTAGGVDLPASYANPPAGGSVLTNFRVKLATSSQFHESSAPRFFQRDKSQFVDGASEDEKGRRRVSKSRCGLELREDYGEYIVGGWEVGTVMDTAASRSHFSSAGSSIGVRTAPNTRALNVAVGVKWWNADQLHRTFMNKENRVVARYERPSDDEVYVRRNKIPRT